jgi:protein-disulfide isomerase
MRELLLCSILAAAVVAPVWSQTPACQALSGAKLELARRLLNTEHPYECCDDTLTRCLAARPTCALAARLADNVCRRIAAGQDETRVRRALSRRARSMVGGGEPAAIDLASAPTLGAADAPVVVTVYACARCPYCSKLVPALVDEVRGGRLQAHARLAFRTFPIRGHEGSTEGGLAFVAAAGMGHFWEFLLHAYRHFDEFAVERQKEWAAAVGLDATAFAARLADPATRDALVASKKEGVANGVEETPTLFLNGRRWVGDREIDELVDAIEEESERVRGRTWRQQ